VRFEDLGPTRLTAVLDLAPDTRPPIREIKGVTLHGLVAERRSGGWIGRVIFDV
jgi:SHS2 domain-containing protein